MANDGLANPRPPGAQKRASARTEIFSPGLRPYSRASILLNNEIGPSIGHLGYAIAAKARERKQLAVNRKSLPLVPFEQKPLVSIRLATYNRAGILLDRTIPSLLRQTYSNLEIVIVGDHCSDDTEAGIRGLGDPRIRFENLERQTDYPRARAFRWRAIGNGPWNRALSKCRGDWIATMDDDDEFTPDHVEVLLKEASRRNLEMVYGKCLREEAPGKWVPLGAADAAWPEIQHSSVLYSSRLAFLRYSAASWIWLESADTNMWHRMAAIGAKVGFVDQVVTHAYGGGLSAPPRLWSGVASAG